MELRKALEKHLDLISANIDTAREAVAYQPTEGRAYQRVQLVPRRTENPTMGDGYYRDTGEFQVFLNYPGNLGTGAVTARAEQIRGHFKRGTTLIEGSSEVLITRTAQIAGVTSIGDRIILPVLITYSVEAFEPL